MKYIKTIVLLFVLTLTIFLTSCKKPNDQPPHEHSYIEGVCECGEKDPNYKPAPAKKLVLWRFSIDDEVVTEIEAEEGVTPEYPAVPENADDNYRWLKLESMVGNQLCYDMILLYEVKICHVQFIDQNGTLLKEQELEWGESATAPSYPENFEVVWDKDFSKVTDDMVINGTIKKLYASLKFYDGTEELDLGISKYNMGDEFKLPDYQKDGYHFLGWFLDEISLTRYTEILTTDQSDFVFYAKLNKNDFADIKLPDASNRIVQINQNGNYFTPVVSGSTLSYTWKVSDDSIIGVSNYGSISVRSCGVAVLTAIYNDNPTIKYNCLVEATSTGVKIVTEEELKTKKLYTVTFKGMNDDIIDTQIVPNGYTAFVPVPYEYDGYAFNGWDKPVTNITEDTVITAKYVVGSNRFAGKKLAILGDSISTYLNHMPEGYAHFYPYPAGDIRDVNHIWWKQVSNALGTSVFVDNAWGGTTCVGGDSATESMVRLQTLLLGEEKPDIVMIFIGTNDGRAKYTNDTFETSYRKMIANIKTLAPETEIILCNLLNLSATNFYEMDVMTGYNNVIKKLANENDLVMIDLSVVNLVSSDFIDSVHPNGSGHKKMADEIISQLRKIQ